MWILCTLAQASCLAVVNYIDEYLTRYNSVAFESSIHERVGGLVLISTLFNFFGVIALSIFSDIETVKLVTLSIIVLSGIAVVGMFLFYFYLLNTYSAHQVVPLFQLVIIWTLLFDFFTGTPLTSLGLFGVIILTLGAYLVDAGSFHIKVPSKLLIMMGVTSFFYRSGGIARENSVCCRIFTNANILSVSHHRFSWIAAFSLCKKLPPRICSSN